jgi:16S rRNA (cytidine1402-2'-O)-methyltransferase
MITFIPTPIGNLDDITLRALKKFETATLFLCEDTRQTKKLLLLLQERYSMVYPESADFFSFHEHNGEKRLEEIAGRLGQEEVVFVSDAGMPAISDPGQLLVAYAQTHDIMYDVLPGANALSVAYAASGFAEGKFLFGTFLPHKTKQRTTLLYELMHSGYNVVLYESPHRLLQLLEEIVNIDENRQVFMAKEISKKYQKYYKESARVLCERLQNSVIKGEWVVVIEGEQTLEKSLSFSEVFHLDIPVKLKAKLLAKLSDKSTKEWYSKLVSEERKR